MDTRNGTQQMCFYYLIVRNEYNKPYRVLWNNLT